MIKRNIDVDKMMLTHKLVIVFVWDRDGWRERREQERDRKMIHRSTVPGYRGGWVI